MLLEVFGKRTCASPAGSRLGLRDLAACAESSRSPRRGGYRASSRCGIQMTAAQDDAKLRPSPGAACGALASRATTVERLCGGEEESQPVPRASNARPPT
ncbi:unnamed protein product [Lampetra fluviatilis]